MTGSVAVDTYDIRFPTSRELDGSDAMNPDPDYSAAYIVLRTSEDGPEGHGFTFTIGRGNDVQVAAIDVLQLDSARVGGVNENLAILLLAAKFGVPVCPHAGGMGLCELVQHLSMFDFVALTGTTEDRVIEFVDHLHEHFLEPVVIDDGHYRAPTEPGFSAEMHQASLDTYHYPHGSFWAEELAQQEATA
ncbi:hypothetical protein BG452_07515 [Streptomyces sp. CBMA123]|nr:hypothetical protein [Streptomyces sp. CBMA123]